MTGTLYIVATPIGNKEDISDRAKRILKEADIVAAEDTRATQVLFRLLDIRNKLISNHKFNEKGQAERLIGELLVGKNIALVSDAGTPCISDPGYLLTREAAARNIDVVGIPGPSAVVTALSISGFNISSYAFYGFFPKEEAGVRTRLLQACESGAAVTVFFESPRRIQATMRIMAEQMPDAEICLCNDLTKLHERIYRGAPADVLCALENNPAVEKGEYTLVIRLPEKKKPRPDAEFSPEAMILDDMVREGHTMKEAVTALAQAHKGNLTKKELYAASLRLKAILSEP